jgi:peroxiredoxin
MFVQLVMCLDVLQVDACYCLLAAEIYKNTNLQVIGVSPDSVLKQAKFVEKQKLNVSLRFAPRCRLGCPHLSSSL